MFIGEIKMKTISSLLIALFVSTSAIAFEKNQSNASVAAEIHTKIESNISIAQIYSSAIAVGIDPVLVVQILIKETKNKDVVIEKLIAAGVDVSVLFSSTSSGTDESSGKTFNSGFIAAPTSSFTGGGGGAASKN